MTELDLDAQREARTSVAEAVYAPGKTPQQCADAVGGLLALTTGPVLLTRADPTQIDAALTSHPGASVTETTAAWRPAPSRGEAIAVVTAGTADLPVAREVAAVLNAYGFTSSVIADVGVAGIHRVLAHEATFARADTVIVVAGMEGALASVVAGLTRAPVIAVPTSTGYGAGLDGITALLGMLASCSPGITVVGIDNGFGAACAAIRILKGARND